MKPRHSLLHVFVIPALLALLTLTGLVTALVAEGIADHFSSAALTLPVLVSAVAIGRR